MGNHWPVSVSTVRSDDDLFVTMTCEESVLMDGWMAGFLADSDVCNDTRGMMCRLVHTVLIDTRPRDVFRKASDAWISRDTFVRCRWHKPCAGCDFDVMSCPFLPEDKC